MRVVLSGISIEVNGNWIEPCFRIQLAAAHLETWPVIWAPAGISGSRRERVHLVQLIEQVGADGDFEAAAHGKV